MMMESLATCLMLAQRFSTSASSSAASARTSASRDFLTPAAPRLPTPRDGGAFPAAPAAGCERAPSGRRRVEAPPPRTIAAHNRRRRGARLLPLLLFVCSEEAELCRWDDK